MNTLALFLLIVFGGAFILFFSCYSVRAAKNGFLLFCDIAFGGVRLRKAWPFWCVLGGATIFFCLQPLLGTGELILMPVFVAVGSLLGFLPVQAAWDLDISGARSVLDGVAKEDSHFLRALDHNDGQKKTGELYIPRGHSFSSLLRRDSKALLAVIAWIIAACLIFPFVAVPALKTSFYLVLIGKTIWEILLALLAWFFTSILGFICFVILLTIGVKLYSMVGKEE